MREGKSQNKSLRIHFHPTYYIMALGYALTGHYLHLITFTSLILIHELGHTLAAKLFKIKVLKITIYPYGGQTKLEDYLNRDLHQEIFVASSGVILQFLFYLLICFLYQKGTIRTYVMDLFTFYNNQIILFNLLPIYPLDGGRILLTILYHFFSYLKANTLIIIFSCINIFLIITIHLYIMNYSNIMVFGILLFYLLEFYKKRKYLYHKFLLERYLYNIYYPKIKIIKDMKKMYQNRLHLFYYNHKYLKEKEVLNHYFSKK